MSNLRTLLAVTALITTGLSVAQTTTPTEPTPAPVTEPAPTTPSTPVLNSLRDLVRNGATLKLVDASGTTIATMQPDGTLKIEAGTSIDKATEVQIVQGDVTTKYTLAARISNGGQLLVATTNANGKAQTLPLVAALNQAAAAAKKADKKPAPAPTPTPAPTTPETEASVVVSSTPVDESAKGQGNKGGNGGSKGGKR